MTQAEKTVSNVTPDLMLHHRFRSAIDAETPDVAEICTVGSALIDQGMIEQATECFSLAVDIMKNYIRDQKIDMALRIENVIYSSFVKKIEHEPHYYACFQHWTDEFKSSAVRLALPKLVEKQNNRVCFVLQNGVLLGHTEVMLRVIQEWKLKEHDVEVYVAALSDVKADFSNLLLEKNITLLHFCGENLDKTTPPAQAIIALREYFQKLEIYKIVWVSLPTYASFALALPLALRQIFWSLKFHPVYFENVYSHVCGGNRTETHRIYHNNKWTVCPFPLTVALNKNSNAKLQDIRSQFSEDALLLGSFGREEKYNSPDYISAIVTIMKNNLHCHFLWAGHNALPQMQDALIAHGVSNRCHFLGWIDTNLYAEIIDVFLETFPFGCGVTGFQAMGHGTPLLSYKSTDTMYGYQLNYLEDDDSSEQFEALPILTAKDKNHYISLAQKLINNKLFRDEIGRREEQYYSIESAMASEYSTRLLNIVFDKK